MGFLTYISPHAQTERDSAVSTARRLHSLSMSIIFKTDMTLPTQKTSFNEVFTLPINIDRQGLHLYYASRFEGEEQNLQQIAMEWKWQQ